MSEYENVTHNFAPVWDEQSRILILGTFPSVKSRENHFYYGHPQNRFWKVLAALTDWVQLMRSPRPAVFYFLGCIVWAMTQTIR